MPTCLVPDNGQPARLVLEFSQVDRATFDQSLQSASQPQLRPAVADAVNTASTGAAAQMIMPNRQRRRRPTGAR